jgi:hypothetical protein
MEEYYELYLLTFRVILLGILFSGSLGYLNNFSPEVYEYILEIMNLLLGGMVLLLVCL